MKPCPISAKSIVVALLFVASGTISRAETGWKPVDPAELAETKGRVDPEAGAEVLLYDIHVDHMRYYDSFADYYRRIKIYDSRGVESYSKIEIRYPGKGRVTDVAARTIKPDGTIVELKKDDIYDREVSRYREYKGKAKAFAPPGLEPGVILEYRFRIHNEPGRFLSWIPLQDEFPVRIARGEIKTYPTDDYHVEGIFFHATGDAEMKPGDRKGTYTFEQVNLPAKKDEPYAPPQLQTSTSILLYYRENERKGERDFWISDGKDLHYKENNYMKASRAVNEAAGKATGDATDPEEKLRRLYDFCRTEIVNRDRENAFTSAESRKLQTNYSPSETLRRGNGNSFDINCLFGALARAAGFEAHLAMVNDRSLLFATSELSSDATMDHRVVAVSVGREWKLFDPGSIYTPFGLMPWEYTDTSYIIANKDGGRVAQIEGPPSGASVQQTRADLAIDASGTLEGNVQLDFTGLWDSAMKITYDEKSPDDRMIAWRDEIREFLPRAEVTNVRFTNADNLTAPLRITYHLRVPDYAERTGSRLFIQPAVFQKGVSPLFRNPKRTSDIMFRFRSTEEDMIVIGLPEGFTIEAGSAPSSQKLGALGEYSVALGTIRNGKALAYKRTLRTDMIALSAKQYDLIKDAFEFIHNQDNHVVTLKRATAAQASGAGSE